MTKENVADSHDRLYPEETKHTDDDDKDNTGRVTLSHVGHPKRLWMTAE